MNKLFFLDDNNNVVDKERSTHYIIQEFDENGNFVGETFGNSKPLSEEEKQKNMNVGEPSEKIQAILDSFTDRYGNHPFRKK